MIAGTHLIICNIIYKYLLKKTKTNLDYRSFAYGNIRPDIEKGYINCEHIFDKSIEAIDAYAEMLIYSNISLKEFSMGLGVICHFVSDYFCLYHQKQYWKKDPAAHGIYEVSLHARLMKYILKNSIKVNYSCMEEKKVSVIVKKFRNKYEKEYSSISKDIRFSIAASAAVSEMIINRRREKLVDINKKGCPK